MLGYRRFLAFLIVPLLTGCAVVAAPSDADPSSTGKTSAPATSIQQNPDCRGTVVVREMKAELAANPYRAGETYDGRRICLRGEISDIYSGNREGYRIVQITVRVDDDWGYAIRKIRDEESRAWMKTLSIGDTLEADCEITFTLQKPDPQIPHEVRGFTDCQPRGGP